MWILPPSIMSAFAQDTEESTSVSPEQWAEACAQSLIARSKPSPARTWSQRWKRDSWTRHLSGLISSPFHGKSFVDWWTSSLEATRASHSQPQVSEPERTTLATFGRGSQMELPFADQGSSSLKTSKDTSRWDSPQSLAIWKSWVTERRGAYSVRLKSALRTSASGSLSWPSVVASEVRQGFQDRSRGKKGSQESLTTAVVKDSAKWPTPAVMDTTGGPYKTEFVGGVFRSYHNHSREDTPKYGARLRDAVTCGPAAQANHSTDGSRRGLWLTPKTGDNSATVHHPQRSDGGQPNLAYQMEKELATREGNWTTPAATDTGRTTQYQQGGKALSMQATWATRTARDNKSGRGNEDRQYKELTPMVERQQSGKLNPRWVETLMGVPIGWTMPSCTSPVTIAPTNSDCSETESCQPQQSELF